MMKIVCISDTHGSFPNRLPSGDLLIHAGDWSSSGAYADTKIFLQKIKPIAQDYGRVICVPGNHDRWVEQNQLLAMSEFDESGIQLLIDQSTVYENTLIYGMPWTPIFGNWAFMGDLAKRKSRNNKIPTNTEILITHGPPLLYLDKLAHNGSIPFAHVGCEAISEALLRVKPKLHAFGHIHEGAGVLQHPCGTLLVNASFMDEEYRPTNPFAVVHL